MKFNTYGNKDKPVAVLLHPMLGTGEMMAMIFSNLLETHYIVAPDFSAHGTAEDDTYISIHQETDTLYHFLEKEDLLDIDLLFGASLGAKCAFELLLHKDIKPCLVYLEGVCMFANGSYLEPAAHLEMKFIQSFSRRFKLKSDYIAARMYGEFGPELNDNFRTISFETIKRIVSDCLSNSYCELDSDMQKRIVFSFGKESNAVQIPRIQKAYPDSYVITNSSYKHCQYMFKYHKAYADKILGRLNRAHVHDQEL